MRQGVVCVLLAVSLATISVGFIALGLLWSALWELCAAVFLSVALALCIYAVLSYQTRKYRKEQLLRYQPLPSQSQELTGSQNPKHTKISAL